MRPSVSHAGPCQSSGVRKYLSPDRCTRKPQLAALQIPPAVGPKPHGIPEGDAQEGSCPGDQSILQCLEMLSRKAVSWIPCVEVDSMCTTRMEPTAWLPQMYLGFSKTQGPEYRPQIIGAFTIRTLPKRTSNCLVRL